MFMMKGRRAMKRITVWLLSILAVFAAFLPFGNPLSEFLVTKNSEIYIEEKFGDSTYFVEEVNYDFKTGHYYVAVSAPESPDSRFTLYADIKGKIGHDTYEDAVVNRWNTAARIDDAYRKAADKVLEGGSIPYEISIGFGEIVFKESGVAEGEAIADYAVSTKTLVLDKEYDIAEMGRKSGKLTVYVYSDDITAEKLAEVILEIRKATDEACVYFKAIDCVVERPQPENGEWRDEQLSVKGFMYDDIYEEGLVERVESNIKQQKEPNYEK